MAFEQVEFWGYIDPAVSATEIIAFGTLQLSTTYSAFFDGRPHYHIPLLSAKTGHRGYGTPIINHLVAEAAVRVKQANAEYYADRLTLEVYVANDKAIRCYTDNGFAILNPDTPETDPQENNESFFIMARNVALAPPPPPPVRMPPTRPKG